MAVTEQLTGAGQVILGISAAAGGLAIVLALLVPGQKRVRSWADRYSVELTEGNGPQIVRYIRRTRSLRAIGGAAGWLAPMVFVSIIRRPFPLGGNSLALALGGYLLGAMIAETTFLRPTRAGELRSASLVPRALADYVAPLTVWALRLIPVVTVGLASLYAVVPKLGDRPVDPSVQFVALISGLLVLFAVTVEAILRAIVGRAQPVTTDDLAAADDAIRASSIHAFSGAAIGMLLVGVGWAVFTVGSMTSVRALHGSLPWLAIVTISSAVYAWIYLGHPRTWRVRHQVAAPLVSGS
jgi:hypothetical protein